MKSKFRKAIYACALITPMLAHSENYVFNFKANPGADGGGVLSSSNDIDFKLFVNTALAPAISIANLNNSNYWANGGFILEMSHNGKSVRLNDLIINPTMPLQIGYGGVIEIYSNIDDFFDVDFDPGASFVDQNALSYNAFVYGQIDVYNNQKEFKDLFWIATTGDTTNLINYASQVPEPTTLGMWALGVIAISYRRKRTNA